MQLPKIPTRMGDREIRTPGHKNGVIGFRPRGMCDGGYVAVAHQDLAEIVYAMIDMDLVLSVFWVVPFVCAVDDLADGV